MELDQQCLKLRLFSCWLQFIYCTDTNVQSKTPKQETNFIKRLIIIENTAFKKILLRVSTASWLLWSRLDVLFNWNQALAVINIFDNENNWKTKKILTSPIAIDAFDFSVIGFSLCIWRQIGGYYFLYSTIVLSLRKLRGPGCNNHVGLQPRAIFTNRN